MDPVTGLLVVSTTLSVMGSISEAKAKKKQLEAEAAARRAQATEFKRRSEYNINLAEKQGSALIKEYPYKQKVGLAGFTSENIELASRSYSTLEENIKNARINADYDYQLIMSGAKAASDAADSAYSQLPYTIGSTILGNAYKGAQTSGNIS